MEPGDLVFGDVDGIVVVPEAVIEEAVKGGMERVSSERVTKKELVAGSLLKQVYDKYGTL